MKSFFRIVHLSAILVSLTVTTSIYSQTHTNDTAFVPRVGQAGKDVIWVPTPDELVNKMLDLADVNKNDILIDLGSGDGKTVIAAAKRGAKSLGIEYNPDMVKLSIKNAQKAGVSDLTKFIKADLFEYDFSEATVITMFLLPDINLKLRPKLLALKPGTRIVSNTFTMGEWVPDYEVTTDENWNSWYTALMWIIPARIQGNWKFEDGELAITQEFQLFYGDYITPNGKSSITDGRITGDKVDFKIDGAVYTGKLLENGNLLGTVTTISQKRDWLGLPVKK
jgi:hypothetical protein